MNTTIEIDVRNDAEVGRYDVWMSNDGSSGAHYRNITARQIGDLAADYVDCLDEAETGESHLYVSEKPISKMYPIRNSADLNECVGQIIDIFEDFLTEKGIALHNDEKNQEDVNPDTCANIYGSDYGYLQDNLESLLMNWGICDKEVRNA